MIRLPHMVETNDQLSKIVTILERREDESRQDRRAIIQELAAIQKRVTDFWMANSVREMSRGEAGASEVPNAEGSTLGMPSNLDKVSLE